MTRVRAFMRSAVFNVWFVAMTTGYGTVGIAFRVWAPGRALGLAQGWARAVLWGLRTICDVQTVVTGREHLPDGAALIASQHQSAFDTLIWLTLVPRVSYVFKAELGQIPLFGPLLVPAGQIPLDRAGGRRAMRSLLAASVAAVAAGRQIVIFPEGTRVAPGGVRALRPGIAAMAMRTGMPIIPVATDSGLLWGRRAFHKRAGTIHVAIGKAMPAEGGQAAVLDAVQRAWADEATRF